MQDPNADTEWNDVLRSKGILPPKEVDISEDQIVEMLENSVQQKVQGKDLSEMTLDELDDKEDEIDEEEEKIFEAYRRQRLQELRESQQKSKFGEVREITKADWVTEVNKAGEDIYVIIHVYKQGIPLCTLMNQHLNFLSKKYPETKFLKGVSSSCIPNYPDKNLPTIFVYLNGDMKKQFIGPLPFGGMKLTQDELEWMLSETGAIKTTLEQDPRREKPRDALDCALKSSNQDDSDDNDW